MPVTQAVRVTERGVRLPLDGRTYEVAMGARRLQLSPDLTVAGEDGARALLVFYPDRYYGRIGHFTRLVPGTTLTINPRADGPEQLFASPTDALRSRVHFRHEGDSLVLKATPEPETMVVAVDEGREGNRILADRRRALAAVGEIYGGILERLAPDAALALLGRVNRIMEREAYRDEASDGRPGGIVELPANKTPVIIGDLHGRVENLVTLLSHNDFLEGVQKEQAALVFLGDAVHREDADALEDMDSSVLMMDLIFRLKVAFPGGVFFILGNHDSFSSELMKDGVPQGMLWERHLLRLRGEEYRDEMQRFYSLCPLMVASKRFVACHAGAPRITYNRQMLLDVQQHPALLHELTWNRQKTRGFAGGYSGADVRRLYQVLGLPEDSTFVVGHYPRSETGSVWLDAGGISRHHVVISARHDEVAVVTRVDGEFVAQTFASERLIPWLDREIASRRARNAAPDAARPLGAGVSRAVHDAC